MPITPTKTVNQVKPTVFLKLLTCYLKCDLLGNKLEEANWKISTSSHIHSNIHTNIKSCKIIGKKFCHN